MMDLMELTPALRHACPSVTPADAGVHDAPVPGSSGPWIPAFAGMTAMG